jgi:hypothetical protein
MMHRRSIHVAAAFGVLVAPLTAWAASTGSVTTSPIHQTPALGMPVLVLLAVALTVITVYRLRRTGGERIVGLGLVAAVMLLAGLVYAFIPTITISGADCAKQTVSVFDPLEEETLLTSNCPNQIQITDIQLVCDEDVVVPNAGGGIAGADAVAECVIGQILANGNTCALLGCRQ